MAGPHEQIGNPRHLGQPADGGRPYSFDGLLNPGATLVWTGAACSASRRENLAWDRTSPLGRVAGAYVQAARG